ncbi:signal peptidase I [Arthrobacter woluwensis]|uniref:signal peptidase I n=1 Tax=Arthrobacter woluwensis TaxID=156980 RepID=UPI001AAFF130|nr:signal peptidase I [Arthrobacter woluwensis]QTF70678.1 signal peptidase I [Arthrobacter woluwensis]
MSTGAAGDDRPESLPTTPDSNEGEAPRAGGGRRRRPLLKSLWFQVLAAVVLVALVQGFLVKVYQVPSGSMENTLNVGDRLLVNRVAYAGSTPQRGDVVVFRKPASWGPQSEHGALRAAVGWFGDLTGIGPGNTDYLVKRVIGVPGDTVACCDAQGKVTVNGTAIDEPYLYQDLPWVSGASACTAAAWTARCFRPVTLGADEYLMLGDHRSNSADSVISCRSAGATPGCARTVSREEIIGRVDWFLFPFSKIGRRP